MRKTFPLLLLSLSLASLASAQPALTIYNQNFAVEREGEGWKQAAYEQGFADEAVRNPAPPAESRLGFQPASAVRDNLGGWWLAWRHGLYRFRDDLCMPVLRADESHPFIHRRWLAEV